MLSVLLCPERCPTVDALQKRFWNHRGKRFISKKFSVIESVVHRQTRSHIFFMSIKEEFCSQPTSSRPLVLDQSCGEPCVKLHILKCMQSNIGYIGTIKHIWVHYRFPKVRNGNQISFYQLPG